MDVKELRDLRGSELSEQIATLRKDLLGLRFANATGELEDTAGLGRTRRDLARALTVARERQRRGGRSPRAAQHAAARDAAAHEGAAHEGAPQQAPAQDAAAQDS
ncbi:MAG: 50S ribosomal protein L29 [Solirubrobacterales bacterium]|nr:50S ribosomal protein L29 [Solirubrobacterales bacterium]